MTKATTTAALVPATQEGSVSTDNPLVDLLRRVDREKPAPADIAALKQMLKEKPEVYDFLMARITTVDEAVIRKITGGGELATQVLLAEANKMRAEMGGASAPALERPLIAHVVSTWLSLQLMTAGYQHRVYTGAGIDLEIGLWWEKRLSMCQRRYLRAVETLARVRRLTAPAGVQINVGERQINVVERPTP